MQYIESFLSGGTNSILTVLLLFYAIREGSELFQSIASIFGYESKAKRKETELQNLLKNYEDRISTLEQVMQELKNQRYIDTRASIEHDEKIEKELCEVSRILLDEQIDRKRQIILNFSLALQNKEHRDQEQFDYIFRVHDDYDELIRTHRKKNGQVSASMQFIKSEYNRHLAEGSF